MTSVNQDITPTQKTIASAANLANLLPTGTVLIPSFSNNGACHVASKYLSSSIIIICALICFFTSFTDSFIDTDRKFYYGIVTRKGMHVLNPGTKRSTHKEEILKKFKLTGVDYFHAYVSLIVFLIFSLTNLNVKNCFFPDAGENLNQVILNLPLGAAVFASFLFTIFPTTRNGIGYTQQLQPDKTSSAAATP